MHIIILRVWLTTFFKHSNTQYCLFPIVYYLAAYTMPLEVPMRHCTGANKYFDVNNITVKAKQRA
jgi:hypothetical protein